MRLGQAQECELWSRALGQGVVLRLDIREKRFASSSVFVGWRDNELVFLLLSDAIVRLFHSTCNSPVVHSSPPSLLAAFVSLLHR